MTTTSQPTAQEALALHRATLEAASEGILVVGSQGQLVTFNSRFQELWNLPDDVLEQRDSEAALQVALDQLRDPEGFRERVEDLYRDLDQEHEETVELKDGRVISWHSRPHRAGGTIVGRISTFRDITDHKRAERDLRHALALHRATLEATGEGILVLDNEGQIQSYNQRFLDMWQVPEQTRPAPEQAGEAMDPHRLFAQAARVYGDPDREGVLVIELLDGRVFERVVRPQRVEGVEVGRVLSYRDVSLQQRAERALKDRAERSHIQAELSKVLTEYSKSPDQLLSLTAACISASIGDTCVIRLLDEAGTNLEPVALYHPDEGALSLLQTLVASFEHPADEGLHARVLETGEDLHLAEVDQRELYGSTPEAYHAFLEEVGIHSLLITPLKAHGQILGTIMVARDQPGNPYSDQDRVLVRDLADRAALSVETARLFDELQDELGRREQVEAALRASERQFRSLFENSPVGIYRTTPEGQVLLANPVLAKMLGLASPEELAKRDLTEVFEPAYDRDAFARELERMDELRGLESTWTRTDGTAFHVRESARVVRDEGGEVVYYEGTVEDVSERVRMEEELREQRDLYASLLRAQSELDEGLAILDLETERVAYANDAYSRITGYDRDQLDDLDSFLALTEPQQREGLQGRLMAIGEDGEELHFTDRLVRRDGSTIWVEGSATRLGTGDQHMLMVLLRDITDRKEAETALEETAGRLAEAQRVARLGSWRIDLASMEADWSPQTFRIFGLEPRAGTVPIEEIRERIHPEDRDAVRETLATSAKTGEPYTFDNRIVHPDGSVRWIHGQGEVVVDEDGQPSHVVGTLQDITERKQAEEEVRRLNEVLEDRVRERTEQLRMANQELEAFSYSVSHDLQAPLQSINGFTNLVLEAHGEALPDQAQAFLTRVHNASLRMRTLIEALLSLSRLSRQPMERRTVDLSAVAREILDRLAEGSDGPKTEVTVEPGLQVEADPGLMEVLLENLVSNAWKFTRGVQAPSIHVGAHEEEEGERTFFVKDNGVGFDMEHAENLFSPFQRLHDGSEFEGTGIGLATVQRIVRRHGGRVWAHAEVNEGATFHFVL